MAAAGQAMVREAMANLKMRKGATLSQIREQLESNYAGKVDFKKRGLLTSALRGLVQRGLVEKNGSNYRLARKGRRLGRRHRRRKHSGRRRRHRRRRRHQRRRSHSGHHRRRAHRRKHHVKRRTHRRRRR